MFNGLTIRGIFKCIRKHDLLLQFNTVITIFTYIVIRLANFSAWNVSWNRSSILFSSAGYLSNDEWRDCQMYLNFVCEEYVFYVRPMLYSFTLWYLMICFVARKHSHCCCVCTLLICWIINKKLFTIFLDVIFDLRGHLAV